MGGRGGGTGAPRDQRHVVRPGNGFGRARDQNCSVMCCVPTVTWRWKDTDIGPEQCTGGRVKADNSMQRDVGSTGLRPQRDGSLSYLARGRCFHRFKISTRIE